METLFYLRPVWQSHRDSSAGRIADITIQDGGETGQVRKDKARFYVGPWGQAGPREQARTINPCGSKTEVLRRRMVVVETLRHMEDLRDRHTQPPHSFLKMR